MTRTVVSVNDRRLIVATEGIIAELCHTFGFNFSSSMNDVVKTIVSYVFNGTRGGSDPFDPVTGFAYTDFKVRRMTAVAAYNLDIGKIAGELSPQERDRVDILYRRSGVDPDRPEMALRGLRIVP